MSGRGISIVIATRDRPLLLRGALDALVRDARPEDEIIVVDSASHDPEVQRVAEDVGARVIRMERAGTARARNAGLRASSSSIVAFIDDDCRVASGWTAGVQAAFEDGSIGFVTGRVVGDRSTPLGVSLVIDEEPRRFEAPADPASYGGGSNMAFRRSALQSIDGFDEGLGPGTPLRAAEDHDALWRLNRAGWSGRYEPSLVVTHEQWRGRTAAVRRQFAYGVGAGAVAVKLIRMGDGNGWPTLAARLGRDGLGAFGRNLARGYRSGALAGLFMFLGALAGALRAATTPLRNGHYGAKA